MADRISAQGIEYKVRVSTGPSVFTLIDGLTGFSPSGGEASEKNATAISDTTPRAIVGNKSPIVLAGECYLDPKDTVHQFLNTAYKNGTKITVKEILSDTADTTRYFQGFVKNFQLIGSSTVDGIYSTAISIVLDGDVLASEPT